MKKIFTLLALLISLVFTSEIIAHENQPRGIDLGEYAFGIPTEQLNFTDQSPFTFSFWVNIKEFNHKEGGTQFINIRSVTDDWPTNEWGYLYSDIKDTGNLFICVRDEYGISSEMNEITEIEF